MRAAPLVLAAALLFAAPGVAAADVIFDPADADDLAATLAEATKTQGVCYGWDVQVSDPISGPSSSVGSDRGAGVPVDEACDEWVRFDADITYTSESSESEDSASYDLSSSSGGPTRSDLDSLGLDWGGLTGEDPDVVIGKAVAALPLLAADTGMAEPIEAAPATGTAPADAQLTDDPDSDWWRQNGGMMLWGIGLLLAAGVFAWWVVRTNRARPGRAGTSPHVPDTVPAEFYEPYDPNAAPAGTSAPTVAEPPRRSQPPVAPYRPDDRTQPVTRPPHQSVPPAPEAGRRQESAPSPTEETEQAPPSTGATPPDQKDKE